jgi:hypothetical protein
LLYSPGQPEPRSFCLCFPCTGRMTGTCHHTQQLVEMGSHEIFAWNGLEPWPFPSQPLKQWGLQAWATVPGQFPYLLNESWIWLFHASSKSQARCFLYHLHTIFSHQFFPNTPVFRS